MDFERELKSALGRREPSPGFAGRVLAGLPRRRRPSPVWRWATIGVAASLLLAVPAGRYQRQRRARQAVEQVMFALQLTAEKLAVAHNTIEELNNRSVP